MASEVLAAYNEVKHESRVEEKVDEVAKQISETKITGDEDSKAASKKAAKKARQKAQKDALKVIKSFIHYFLKKVHNYFYFSFSLVLRAIMSYNGLNLVKYTFFHNFLVRLRNPS